VAYISSGRVVGLSKTNRIVDHFAKRPQVQECLTMQIVKELQKDLDTEDVACVNEAKHLCVNSRVIRDIESKAGMPGFLEMINAGRQDRLSNFLRVAEKYLGITEKNFDTKVKVLFGDQ
jgi:GTP cyclohydrolase I